MTSQRRTVGKILDSSLISVQSVVANRGNDLAHRWHCDQCGNDGPWAFTEADAKAAGLRHLKDWCRGRAQ